MSNWTVQVHLCSIRRVNMHKIVVKNGISHIFKLLKLVCDFAIGDAPIHDVAHGRNVCLAVSLRLCILNT